MFPVEVNLQIAGTEVEIASLEAPAPKDRRRATFAGLNGVRDLPTIEADGDALFANSRLGAGAEPYDLVEFDLVLGVGLTVVAGLIVTREPRMFLSSASTWPTRPWPASPSRTMVA